MSTTRYRRRAIGAHQITPAALAAYRAEDRKALHHELRLPPWQVSPLDAHGDCPWPPTTAGATSWPLSCELREALEAA